MVDVPTEGEDAFKDKKNSLVLSLFFRQFLSLFPSITSNILKTP